MYIYSIINIRVSVCVHLFPIDENNLQCTVSIDRIHRCLAPGFSDRDAAEQSASVSRALPAYLG